MMNIRWVRSPKQNRPTPEYDLTVVQQALRSAIDIGRYDVAQQIVEEAKADVCIICGTALATCSVLHAGTNMQLCDECASEWQ
jgi:hypothetical protein